MPVLILIYGYKITQVRALKRIFYSKHIILYLKGIPFYSKGVFNQKYLGK